MSCYIGSYIAKLEPVRFCEFAIAQRSLTSLQHNMIGEGRRQQWVRMAKKIFADSEERGTMSV